ncbi:hypothetical protein ABZS76_35885 [Streptomyces sp. NPDC005562]|uniref:hypothetical protein n=1 Tax=unclassified Streptomyces TaxID=2593676 RepID=UPI0033BB9374
MGTLTNGRTTIPYEHHTAPGLDWRKAGRTDLDPILKELPDGEAMSGSSRPPRDNGASLKAGPVCSEHTGPPAPTIRSSARVSICPICTPLGSTPERTRAIVQRQNEILDNPYWRDGGPCT